MWAADRAVVSNRISRRAGGATSSIADGVIGAFASA